MNSKHRHFSATLIAAPAVAFAMWSSTATEAQAGNPGYYHPQPVRTCGTPVCAPQPKTLPQKFIEKHSNMRRKLIQHHKNKKQGLKNLLFGNRNRHYAPEPDPVGYYNPGPRGY